MNRYSPQIELNTQAFLDQFGALNKDQLNWKPNANAWSIAQNIDHLIIINQSYFPVFASLKEGTNKVPFLGRMGFMVSFLGKMILKSVQPDRKKRIKTFPIWEPNSSQIESDILDQFEIHQEELKQQMENCQQWIDQGAVISSPANGNIVYKLEVAFDIIIAHEKRHLEQAKEVLSKLPV